MPPTGSTKTFATYFLLDGEQPLCELDANPSPSHIVKRINTFGANGLVSRDKRGGTDEFYTYDPQGNLAQITDGSGNVTVSLQADAFGQVTSSNGSTSTVPGSGSLRAYGFGECLLAAIAYSSDPSPTSSPRTKSLYPQGTCHPALRRRLQCG